MTGETDIFKLLHGLDPRLDPETYVFVTLSKADEFVGLFPLMLFNEDEGVTGIVPAQKAKSSGIKHEFECRRITLSVHSALHAVGLIALVSDALQEEEIPCNVVSAFYHDHIFVPEHRAERTMAVLKRLAGEPEEDLGA